MKKNMKKLVAAAMMLALIATGSMYAQWGRSYDTETFNRAEELMNEGKLDESLTLFELELKENPKNPHAYFLMTTIYMEQERYDYAMPAIDKALKYMPKRYKEMRGIAHALKATIHETYQEWEEAIEQLTLCLSVMPKDKYMHRAMAHQQRGELYHRLGKYELAEQDFKKSEELGTLLKNE